MLEAEKPFMFASSSTGRPATANDFNSAANATSAEVSVNTSNAGSSNASGLPRIVPPQQKPQTPQEGASQLTPTQPPPPPPPPPQPQSQGITTATSLPPDHRITLPPATVPPPTPYYHPHHYHHQHHQHQHHQLHQHPHHSASAVSAPPPPSVKEEEGYHYHQHPAHAPAAYGRQHPERDSAYTYRPATSSSGLLNVGAEAYTHPQQPQSQQQRRQQQQQPPPPPPPHHQHTHHAPPPPPPPPHHHTGSPYHVHHLHQHIPQQQAHTQVVSEEQSYYGASGAATGVNVNGSTYLTEVDDSDAWFEGQSDGAAESRRAKKRKEYTARIERINAAFMDSRECLYAEKVAEIQEEVKKVHDGTHVAFLEGVAELENIRIKTIEEGRLFRDYQDSVTDRQFNQEIALAEEEYMNEKRGVREKLFATLEEKRRKLKEDKDNCELSYDILMESQARILKRNLRRRGLDHNDNKANKRKQLSDARPGLIFKLKEDDIQSDIEQMCIGTSYEYTFSYSSKKAVGVSRKK
ncbi:hypothetical protein VTP01DRAFT_8014 [Rhizomucor pusillus]|uniref:uncharacterized protein n=1 Tax=Rhizomucor pusillus TaxID=4840 RepID=UPI003744B0F3